MDLADAARLLASVPPQGRADASLAAFRSAVGEFDPSDAAHAGAARRWLNQWGCRIGYPGDGQPDAFSENLSAWGSIWMSRLPDVDLVALDDPGIATLAAALEDLAAQRADRRRTFGRTASAKLLFALRPATVTAWDDAIARRPGVAGDFGAHLRDARALARTWVDQAAGGAVPQIVGRPESTLAKIVDEVLYLTCTRGLT
jgi:hypothetical protein